jgi:hypothetical protein
MPGGDEKAFVSDSVMFSVMSWKLASWMRWGGGARSG